jgi:hypothetical protein
VHGVVLGEGWDAFEASFPWRSGEHHVEWRGADADYWNYATCRTCGCEFGTFSGGMWPAYLVRDGQWVNDAHCPSCKCAACLVNPQRYEDRSERAVAQSVQPTVRGRTLFRKLARRP